MVFIEYKSHYLQTVVQSMPPLSKFIRFLFGSKSIPENSNRSTNVGAEIDELIEILESESESAFREFISNYQRRTPDENSAWINSNYLIYLLIVGSIRFGTEMAWLESAIKLRRGETEKRNY